MCAFFPTKFPSSKKKISQSYSHWQEQLAQREAQTKSMTTDLWLILCWNFQRDDLRFLIYQCIDSLSRASSWMGCLGNFHCIRQDSQCNFHCFPSQSITFPLVRVVSLEPVFAGFCSGRWPWGMVSSVKCQVSLSPKDSQVGWIMLDYVFCLVFCGEAKRLILRMPEEASLEAQKVGGSLRFGIQSMSCANDWCNWYALLGWHAAVARHGLAKPALRCLDS